MSTTPAQKPKPSPELDFRAASFAPSSFNEEARTVDVIWTTGARVERYHYSIGRFIEELEVSKSAVDLGRLNAGAPVLNAHSGSWDARSIMANVVPGSAKIVGKEGVATVRFDSAENDPDAEKVFRKIGSGIVSGSSVGYRVLAMQKTNEVVDGVPVYRVTKWEPMEISVAPIPADIGSKFRSFSMPSENAEPTIIDNNTTSALAERERIQGITISARAAKFSDKEIDALIASGASVEAARSQILEEVFKRDEAKGLPGSGVTVGQDFSDRTDEIVKDVLARKMGLHDLARVVLTRSGIRSPSNPVALMQRAHSTSDFGLLLADVADKKLRQIYTEAPSTLSWVERTQVRDFKPKDRVQVGALPGLLKLTEGAEIQHGTFGESKEIFQLASYARQWSLTRQALINDDLSAFESTLDAWARSSIRLEHSLVYDLLQSNSGAGPEMSDGVNLFHADHGNLGTAGAFNDALLAAGEVLMRTQVGLQGEALDLFPRALIVGPQNAHAARLLLAKSSRVVSSGLEADSQWSSLDLIVENRVSASRVYMVAYPTQGATACELGTLGERPGPEIDRMTDWDTKSEKFSILYDVGAAFIDFRAIVALPVS